MIGARLLGPVAVGTVAFRDPAPWLAVIAKLTVALPQPGTAAEAVVSAEPAPLLDTEELPTSRDEEPGSELLTASEFAPRKAYLDLTMEGFARSAAPATHIRVAMHIGDSFSRELVVFASAPTTRIPLRPPHLRDARSHAAAHLAPRRTVGEVVHRPRAAEGVEATFAPSWIDLPPSENGTLFQVAPPDLWMPCDAVLGTTMLLEGVGPAGVAIRTRLPSCRAYAFALWSRDQAVRIDLRCDTLHIAPEEARATLLFRGALRLDLGLPPPTLVLGVESLDRATTLSDIAPWLGQARQTTAQVSIPAGAVTDGAWEETSTSPIDLRGAGSPAGLEETAALIPASRNPAFLATQTLGPGDLGPGNHAQVEDTASDDDGVEGTGFDGTGTIMLASPLASGDPRDPLSRFAPAGDPQFAPGSRSTEQPLAGRTRRPGRTLDLTNLRQEGKAAAEMTSPARSVSSALPFVAKEPAAAGPPSVAPPGPAASWPGDGHAAGASPSSHPPPLRGLGIRLMAAAPASQPGSVAPAVSPPMVPPRFAPPAPLVSPPLVSPPLGPPPLGAPPLGPPPMGAPPLGPPMGPLPMAAAQVAAPPLVVPLVAAPPVVAPLVAARPVVAPLVAAPRTAAEEDVEILDRGPLSLAEYAAVRLALEQASERGVAEVLAPFKLDAVSWALEAARWARKLDDEAARGEVKTMQELVRILRDRKSLPEGPRR